MDIKQLFKDLRIYFSDLVEENNVEIYTDKLFSRILTRKRSFSSIDDGIPYKVIDFQGDLKLFISKKDALERSEIVCTIFRNIKIEDLKKFVSHNSLSQSFVGVTPTGEAVLLQGNLITNTSNYNKKLKVLAVVSVHNDEDIIDNVLRYLIGQDLDILVLDNWSTDDSNKIIRKFVTRYSNQVFLEMFPKDKPNKVHDWANMLDYKVHNSISQNYDWIIHYDSDEIRIGPWRGISLGNSIRIVDKLGFNAINFTLLDFRPTKSNYTSDTNLQEFFKYFEMRDTPSAFLQVKAWKNFGQEVDIKSNLGHDVIFHDKKVFPIKFLLKHYPLRSEKSAKTKIFKNRMPRYISEMRTKGIHRQYDKFSTKDKFLWSTQELNFFESDEIAFEKYMLEFLTGIGIKKV
jgi:hypothetical protein